MSGMALSGLASGVDTESIIAQLMAVERTPRTRMQLADTQAEARQTQLRELSTKLGAVRDAAAALRSVTTWADTQKLTSSDSARIAISAAGTAAPGSRLLEVSQLAVSAQHAFDYTASASPQSITIGSFTLAVDANADAATVASALNARDDAPVSAVVAGGKLVLTSRTSGLNGDFTVGATPLLAEDTTYRRAGADAAYKLDGVSKTSPSNVLTNVFAGAEVTLKATTSTPVSVEVTEPGVDPDAITAKVKAFVTAYNAAAEYIRGKVSEKPVKDPSTNFEATKGLFFGDTMLSGVVSEMRKELGDFADLGISTGAASGTATFSADAVAGRLTLDETKLKDALASDTAGLRARLEDLGGRISGVVAPVAGQGVDERLSSVDATRKRLADSMAAIDVRLADREKRLRAQFSAMESALAASQSAQAQLQAQLSRL